MQFEFEMEIHNYMYMRRRTAAAAYLYDAIRYQIPNTKHQVDEVVYSISVYYV